MRFGTDKLPLDNDTVTGDGPTTIPKTSPQQLKVSIIQWLADDQMARWYKQTVSILPEVLALAQQLDDAIDECYDNKMSKKATIQIKR